MPKHADQHQVMCEYQPLAKTLENLRLYVKAMGKTQLDEHCVKYSRLLNNTLHGTQCTSQLLAAVWMSDHGHKHLVSRINLTARSR